MCLDIFEPLIVSLFAYCPRCPSLHSSFSSPASFNSAAPKIPLRPNLPAPFSLQVCECGWVFVDCSVCWVCGCRLSSWLYLLIVVFASYCIVAGAWAKGYQSICYIGFLY
ncbi:hypothetical protein Droror1_Dr00027464 [Drosera rotundifolia]